MDDDWGDDSEGGGAEYIPHDEEEYDEQMPQEELYGEGGKSFYFIGDLGNCAIFALIFAGVVVVLSLCVLPIIVAFVGGGIPMLILNYPGLKIGGGILIALVVVVVIVYLWCFCFIAPFVCCCNAYAMETMNVDVGSHETTFLRARTISMCCGKKNAWAIKEVEYSNKTIKKIRFRWFSLIYGVILTVFVCLVFPPFLIPVIVGLLTRVDVMIQGGLGRPEKVGRISIFERKALLRELEPVEAEEGAWWWV